MVSGFHFGTCLLIIVMKIDLKTSVTLATLLFAIAGFYYKTKNDLYIVSLEIRGLKTENYDIRKRLDSLNKKTNKINKRLKGIGQEKLR